MAPGAMVRNLRSTVWVLGYAVAVSLLAGGSIVLADYYAVAPGGSQGPKSALILLLGLPFLAVLAVIPVALACCLWKRCRRIAFHVLLSCGIFAFVVYASIGIGDTVRMNGFRSLAQRSAPLVEAIKAYERANGHPPPTLESIVPEYLPSIPGTGMGAYPKYRYVVGREELYDGNPWILMVFTPSGILNFDKFLYYPSQDYGSWCGDPLERVADWAYLHE